MKANEAPEKIYRTTLYLDNDKGDTRWKKEPVAGAENIEYVRKDAFIEKALKWLKEHADDYDYTWYNEMEGESGITDKCIEDFRKYMEEE